MTNPAEGVLECEDFSGLISAMNKVVLSLPNNKRVELNKVFSNYLRTYGLEVAFVILNGRSVKSLLAESGSLQEIEPIAKGTIEGVTFALYEGRDSTN